MKQASNSKTENPTTGRRIPISGGEATRGRPCSRLSSSMLVHRSGTLLLALIACASTLWKTWAQDLPQLSLTQGRGLPSFDKSLLAVEESSSINQLAWFDVADLNGDGRLDIIAAEAAGSSADPLPPYVAAVYLQTSARTFERQPNPQPLPIDDRIRVFSVRDFNRDGRLDLLLLDRSIDILLLPGQSDGTFGPPVRSGIVATRNSDDPVRDLNGDSLPDLVVTAQDRGVTVLLNSGDGTFRDSQSLDPSSTLDDPAVTLIGDVNRDGKPDIVVCSIQDWSLYTGNLDVFLNKGDGTFGEVIRMSNVAAWQGVLADFDNDGQLDYAGLRAAPLGVEIWRGRGDGRFLKRTTHQSSFDPWELGAGDLNGDGIMDLCVYQRTTDQRLVTTLGICLGNGDGTFQAWRQHSPFEQHYSGPFRMTDLDGDKRLDLAVAVLPTAASGKGSRIAINLASEPPIDPARHLITVHHAAQRSVVLEFSPDLASWTRVATNAPTGPWPVNRGAGESMSFYRARVQ